MSETEEYDHDDDAVRRDAAAETTTAAAATEAAVDENVAVDNPADDANFNANILLHSPKLLASLDQSFEVTTVRQDDHLIIQPEFSPSSTMQQQQQQISPLLVARQILKCTHIHAPQTSHNSSTALASSSTYQSRKLHILRGSVSKKRAKRSVCNVPPFSIDRLPLSVKYGQLCNLLECASKTFSPSAWTDLNYVISDDISLEELWDFKRITMEKSMILVNKFALHVPGFVNPSSESQRSIVLSCSYPIMSCTFATTYQANSFKWFSFSFNNIEALVEKHQMLRPLFQSFKRFSKLVQHLKLDEIELACLSAIFLLDMSNIWPYKELLLNALEWYETDVYPNQTRRYHHVLYFIRLMTVIHQTHSNLLYKLHAEPPYTSLPSFIVDDAVFNEP